MEKIIVGEIINTHGVRGELKVRRTGEETFDRNIEYFISNKPVKITSSRFHKGTFIIKIENFDNINDVLFMKGKNIEIKVEDLIELEEDTFYIKDLIGVDVFENDLKIGVLKDILEYEVNDVYIIETESGEIMVPAVDEFILNVDTKQKRIDVKTIEGM